MKKAVILLSGGLDSCTVLAMIRKKYDKIYAISFNYSQRHRLELEKAKNIAKNYNVEKHIILDINFEIFQNCSLVNPDIAVPKYEAASEIKDNIPSTYVPARNTIFLSYALAAAESFQAFDIFIGVHQTDSANYPDCRPEFIDAYQNMANLATKIGVMENKIKFHAPIIAMSKTDVVKEGLRLGVDYGQTISCYDPDQNGASCGKCHACLARLAAFKDNNTKDPIQYQ